MSILNLDAMPSDPIQRLMWLSGVKEQVARELDVQFAEAYFESRLQGQFDLAVQAGPYAKKRALAYTRKENQKRGRAVRWNDGLDPTSTAYKG